MQQKVKQHLCWLLSRHLKRKKNNLFYYFCHENVSTPIKYMFKYVPYELQDVKYHY